MRWYQRTPISSLMDRAADHLLALGYEERADLIFRRQIQNIAGSGGGVAIQIALAKVVRQGPDALIIDRTVCSVKPEDDPTVPITWYWKGLFETEVDARRRPTSKQDPHLTLKQRTLLVEMARLHSGPVGYHVVLPRHAISDWDMLRAREAQLLPEGWKKDGGSGPSLPDLTGFID